MNLFDFPREKKSEDEKKVGRGKFFLSNSKLEKFYILQNETTEGNCFCRMNLLPDMFPTRFILLHSSKMRFYGTWKTDRRKGGEVEAE